MKSYNSNIAIVTSADENYFEMLNELINSILRHESKQNIKICVVDGGLNEAQIQELKKKVFSIKKVKHNLQGLSKFENTKYFAGLVSRVFLRETFPEFEKYIWIDSDAWVNSWKAIDYLIEASSDGKLAAVATADRHNEKVLSFKWLFSSVGIMKSQNFKHAISSGYGQKIARSLALKPHVNCGVFALNHESKFWDVWKKHFKFSLLKGRFFGSDQLAMNICIYHEKLNTELLPHFCNWIPNSINTLWDENKKCFVEQFFPNNEIGIMHLAGGIRINGEDMRYNKDLKIELKTVSGNKIKKSLRYCID